MASLPSYSSTVNCHCHGGFKNNNNNISIATIMAALPDEILKILLNKLDLVEFHRIGAVCTLWRQFLFKPKFLKPQFPLLMLSFSESRRDLAHQGFFSAFHGKVYNLEMPKLRGARCCGSNWGWLIMLGNVERCMFLYNPFTRVRIELPPKSTLPLITDFEYCHPTPNYIRKAMLLSVASATTNNFNLDKNKLKLVGSSGSAVAIPDDCLVIALYLSRHLAFCRPRDGRWQFSNHGYIKPPFGIEDFIVYEGRLYAVKQNFDLILLELLPRIRETSCNIAPPSVDLDSINPGWCHIKSLYLVESRGELLMVTRWIKFDRYGPLSPTTYMFWIFKLDLQHRRWVKVEDLGDQMLFVGTNTGFSCSALHYDGFKGNSIYFTDDCFHYLFAIRNKITACDDLGVFHLEDNSIEFNFYPTYSHSYASPPIWFAPIPWYGGKEVDLWTVQLSKRVDEVQVSSSPQTSNQQVHSPITAAIEDDESVSQLYVDGAWDKATGRGGRGCILWNQYGLFLAAKAKECWGLSALAVKLEAIRDGLFLATSLSISSILISSDSLLAVAALNDQQPRSTDWVSNSLFREIKNLCLNFSFIRFRYVNRVNNSHANRLAQGAKIFSLDKVWWQIPPWFVIDISRLASRYVSIEDFL